jgi:phosphatidate cytidylyltransferase
LTNFIQRSITGIIYVAILIASILVHPFAFAIVFAGITAVGLSEFYNLAASADIRPWKYTGIIAGVILFIVNFLYVSGFISLSVLICLLLLSFSIFFLGLIKWREKIIPSLGVTFLGILYIAVPLSLLTYLCYPGKGPSSYTYEILLEYLFILWLYDTGAYISGSLLGKHKITEKISPGKTWEGLTGGLILSIAVAFFVAKIFKIIPRTDWLVISLITVVTGTLGDLVESGIKRNAGIKDSGHLLPGHGGMLDRIDSVLLSVPFVLLFLILRNYY